jgi:hypothetical protein
MDLSIKLEPTDLVTLGHNDEHGRIVIAAASITTGTKSIRETPVLVWDKDNWMELLAKFKVLPDVIKDGVLDMYCFPLDFHQLLPFKYEITRCASV